MSTFIIGFTKQQQSLLQTFDSMTRRVFVETPSEFYAQFTQTPGRLLFINLYTEPWAAELPEYLRECEVRIPIIGFSLPMESPNWADQEQAFLASGGTNLFALPIDLALIGHIILSIVGDAQPKDLVPVTPPSLAIARRAAAAVRKTVIPIGEKSYLTIDLRQGKLKLNGHEVPLTATELCLIKTLVPDRNLRTRRSLLQTLKECEPSLSDVTHVDALVQSIHAKIRHLDPSAEPCIKNVWNQGYKLVA